MPHRLRLAFVLAATLLLGAASSPSSRPTLAQADALFGKKLYQQALEKYDALARGANGETRGRALFRAAECEALLFRYGEASARAESAELPAAPLWRARFLILRAELAREFLKQYHDDAPADRTTGTSDLTRRTPQEWHGVIRRNYEALWAMRNELLVPLRDEAYFFDVQKADLEAVPTLWDLVVSRWKEYLITESEEMEPADRPAPESVIGETYKPSLHFGSPSPLVAAALLEGAAGMGGRNRGVARELWRIERIKLPFESPDRFARPENTQTLALSAAKLFESWSGHFTQARARAQAGLEGAGLYAQAKHYAEAVSLCRRVQKEWPDSASAPLCTDVRASIELPALALEAYPAPPPAKKSIHLTSRNLTKVFFRAYPTTPTDLVTLARQRRGDDWSALRTLDDETVRAFARRPAVKNWSFRPRYDQPYEQRVSAVDPPALEPGLYVVLAASEKAFQSSHALVAGVILNVTKLFLFTSAGLETTDPAKARRANGFHAYTIDALSGRPVEGARIDAFWNVNWSPREKVKRVSDREGRAQFPIVATLETTNNLDPLASWGPSYALLPGSLFFSRSEPARFRLFTDLDRPIYRPGQTAHLKITALERNGRELRAYNGNAHLSLSVMDANGQEFFATTLRPNPFGSIATTFTVPTGRLLGTYQVRAWLTEPGGHFEDTTSFSVEEYKRPEFEVSLKEAAEAWRYGQTAEVRGEARYYFGGAVPEAAVSYRVFRETYVPWICWWWAWRRPGSRKEVSHGELKTDRDGNFLVRFRPEPEDAKEKDPLPSHYVVEITSRDSGGRTLTAQKSYVAGAKAYLFDLQLPGSFLRAGLVQTAQLRILNLSEKPVSTQASFTLFRLEKPPVEPTVPKSQGIVRPFDAEEEGDEEDSPEPEHKLEPTLEDLYRTVPNGPAVAAGDVVTSGDDSKPASLAWRSLPEGVYRLEVRAKDPWGGENTQSIIVLVTGSLDAPALPLPEVTLVEHKKYEVGETARVLLGSHEFTGTTYLEIWEGERLRETRLLGGGLHQISFTVEKEDRGGITLRWFGAHDFRPREGTARIEVPWDDKALTLSLPTDPKAAPSSRVSWKLAVKDRAGKPVDGEATVRVYDRSLEYYARAAGPWQQALYTASPSPERVADSLYKQWGTLLFVNPQILEEALGIPTHFHHTPPTLSLPGLRLQQGRYYFPRRYRGGGGGGAMAPLARAKNKGMDMESFQDKADASATVSAKKAEAAPAAPPGPAPAPGAPPPPPRSNFAETACFEPQLPIADGAGEVQFTFPDQLTSWRVEASVLTRDAKWGIASHTVATSKDLMVRLEMPRFFREADHGTLKALVHNETAQALSGTLTLSVKADGKNAEHALRLRELERSFQVPAHGLATLVFPIEVTTGPTALTVRAVARAGELVDAEERELPILPSRERLVDSRLAWLDGKQGKRLTLPALGAGDSVESVTLQVEPQLALPLLESLPFLVHYPYECSEQIANRFVPLAIIDKVFAKYPALATAAKQIPPRTSVTKPWDASDPRRQIQLIESPWMFEAQGGYSGNDVTNLLDPKVVKKEKDDALALLKTYQLGSGAFPWFPGGRDDFYITLYLLESFAHAREYGVEVPEEMMRAAFQYSLTEAPKHLRGERGDLALLLYASYVLTSYAPDFAWARPALAKASELIAFADRHSDALTPLGKAYAAFVYRRLGDKAKSDRYLDRATDGAREDEVTGLYWQPEKISWLWYNDSVEKHAFFLHALTALRPADKRIPAMVKWLLFNRKGNQWKSTKASASAIFSLLDVLKGRGALDRVEHFSWNWTGQVQAFDLKPFQWLSSPLRWTKTQGSAAALSSARVDKDGPGLAFASLTRVFATDHPSPAKGNHLLDLQRKLFKRQRESTGTGFKLVPLDEGAMLSVGDEIEVQLVVTSRSQFEYVHLKSPRGAGFEPEDLLSGWKWDPLSRYEEQRDSLSNNFVSWLPQGEYRLSYRLRATTAGRYRFSAASLQSLYAPEFAAYSDSIELRVKE